MPFSINAWQSWPGSSGLGSAVGAGIGGLALIVYGYEALGIALGSMGVVAAAVFKFVTIGPMSPQAK